MPEEYMDVRKKKFKFVPLLIKILLLTIVGLVIYFLFIFNILKMENFSVINIFFEKSRDIITVPENAQIFLYILFVFVVSNILLTFFLLTRKSGTVDYKFKSEIAKKQKEMEKNVKAMREDINTMRVKFSSILLRYRELMGSLEKDKIVKLIFNILEKSAGAKTVSIFLVDDANNDIFMLGRYGDKVDKDLKIAMNEKNIIAHSVREGKSYTVWDEDNIIKNLFSASPVKCEVVAPIFKDKVMGVIVIEEFKDRELDKIEEEAKLIITTTSSIAAMALDKANVFEMTQDELQSEKKFSAKQMQEKKALRSSFQKYTSPAIVEQLTQNPDMLKLGGKKAELTVLFSDIVGFTTYSEKYAPEKVVSILNDYLTAMTDVIMEYNGTLDKFVGDEIMAIWGAPVPQEDHAELAVKCGFSMLEKLKELRGKWEKEGVEPFDIGIGINTGEMIVGNMGSPKRMDYTVIGDSVNTGARIESLTRQFKTSFIVSESTYLKVRDEVEGELLGKVSVKGKSIQIKVYKLTGLK
ncbi:MAG: adenylate/guanylate cyclase domain-containing protein [Candidatus Muiribacteriaceae bacterium]